MTPQPSSLYIHIPFCHHRCAYCDFNTYAGQEESIPAYVDALCREIEFTAKNAPAKITLHTIFFGGGTPSLLSPNQFESILDTIFRNFNCANPEVTIEANPGTVSLRDLQDMRALRINRISFGVQSANPFELQMLERAHTYFDVINAVSWARKAGFDNLNLDLIYGLPSQTLDDWSGTVKLILELEPEHLSLYALTMEHGTPFGHWSARGLIPFPDPDLAADMYEWVDDVLESAGFHQYEISNWAKDDFECHHNLQYWRGLPYLAVGAGAHGYVNGYRYSNVLRIKTYIDRLNTDIGSLITTFPLTPATVNQHSQKPQDDMGEFMMTGLRLTHEGITSETFKERFGQELEVVFGKEIEDLIGLGLLTWHAERLVLTRRGRLLGNQVFVKFIS